MTRFVLRIAAFACGLGLALPSFGQTPTITTVQSPTQEVEFPQYQRGGAVRLYNQDGFIIGGAAHPMLIACPDGSTTCFGGLGASGGCAGQTLANTNFTPWDNNGAATTLKLAGKVSGQKIYICGFKAGPAAAAINVTLVEGTKTTNECDTGAKGLLNGATAARGDQLTANSGYVWGTGQGVIAVTPDANNDVCVVLSGTAQTGGQLIWAQF